MEKAGVELPGEECGGSGRPDDHPEDVERGGVPIQAYLTCSFERFGTHRDVFALPVEQLTPAAFERSRRRRQGIVKSRIDGIPPASAMSRIEWSVARWITSASGNAAR